MLQATGTLTHWSFQETTGFWTCSTLPKSKRTAEWAELQPLRELYKTGGTWLVAPVNSEWLLEQSLDNYTSFMKPFPALLQKGLRLDWSKRNWTSRIALQFSASQRTPPLCQARELQDALYPNGPIRHSQTYRVQQTQALCAVNAHKHRVFLINRVHITRRNSVYILLPGESIRPLGW